MHIRVFSLFLMIPSTDLSKNFHSSFFSLSPLPVKFWWGLVENCKFFIPKFTIFKSLKNFQKKVWNLSAQNRGCFWALVSENGHFWKKWIFWVKGTQRSEISSRSFSYLWMGVKSHFFMQFHVKNDEIFQNLKML